MPHQIESRHNLLPPTMWLMGIGEELRAEYAAIEQPLPLPKQLATLIKQLEAGENYPQLAAVRPASIDVGAGELGRRLRREALGRFEKLVLDLFDNHLQGRERESAVQKFVAYVRLCHAMLDSGVVKESELDGSTLTQTEGGPHRSN